MAARTAGMNSAIERIRTGAVVFGVTVFVATAGYVFLFQRTWIDALYLVVITVTSVGFTDSFDERGPPSDGEQLFTIGVIVFGLTAGAYAMGGFLQLMTEGEIQRALGKRRMNKDIERLSNHIIVCGFGRIGRILTKSLKDQNRPFVILEKSAEHVADAEADGYLILSGDATEEDLLLDAGIERASSLVTTLPKDADNVFITLTARGMNADIQIIARAEYRSTEKKLLQAGANRVVMPASTGAIQMSQMITRPNTADFFELIADRTQLNLEFDEIIVSPGNKLIGKTVGEAEAHRTHGLLVLAVKRTDGEMIFNPSSEFVFSDGDTMIVIGEPNDIDQFEKTFHVGKRV